LPQQKNGNESREEREGCEGKAFSPSFFLPPSHDNLLIEFYLSFFDKKDLNNGIDWFIPCTMKVIKCLSL
jgi:hypothetical protein